MPEYCAEILWGAADGVPHEEIAAELGLSRSTVDNRQALASSPRSTEPSPAQRSSRRRSRRGARPTSGQCSTDGGKTWISSPGTLQAKTTIAGLTPTANVQFRYRALTRTGEGDWSQPVALVIS
jgi:hypothetical protein